MAHEAGLCFKLPDNELMMEGALIEPLAVGFHAARQGGAQAGQVAVVTGAGCIGLVSMMALKAMGVSKVYSVDVMDKRLDKALESGADGVINGSREDAVKKVMELTGGMGCDLHGNHDKAGGADDKEGCNDRSGRGARPEIKMLIGPGA